MLNMTIMAVCYPIDILYKFGSEWKYVSSVIFEII